MSLPVFCNTNSDRSVNWIRPVQTCLNRFELFRAIYSSMLLLLIIPDDCCPADTFFIPFKIGFFG